MSEFSVEEQQALARIKKGKWYVAPKLKIPREVLDGLVKKGLLTCRYNGMGRDANAEFAMKYRKRRMI